VRTHKAHLVVFGIVALLAGCGNSSGSSSGGTTNPNPVILSPPDGSTLPAATVGVVYSQSFTIVGGGASPPYTMFSAGVPGGLAFVQDDIAHGTLSGTPTTPGTGIFQLQVVDDANQTTTANYQLQINSATGAIVIAPATLPGATSGTAYSVTLTATSGTAPFTWASTGTFPPGVSLGTFTSKTNSVSGTPTVSGAYTFTVTVTDSLGLVGTITYTLVVS